MNEDCWRGPGRKIWIESSSGNRKISKTLYNQIIKYILVQINNLKYLGNVVSYSKEVGINYELNSYIKIRLHVLSLFTLLHGSEFLTIKARLFDVLAQPTLLHGSEC